LRSEPCGYDNNTKSYQGHKQLSIRQVDESLEIHKVDKKKTAVSCILYKFLPTLIKDAKLNLATMFLHLNEASEGNNMVFNNC